MDSPPVDPAIRIPEGMRRARASKRRELRERARERKRHNGEELGSSGEAGGRGRR